jgi:hypothetical protein
MSSGQASAGVGPRGLRHLNLGTLDWDHASRLSKIDHPPDEGIFRIERGTLYSDTGYR